MKDHPNCSRGQFPVSYSSSPIGGPHSTGRLFIDDRNTILSILFWNQEIELIIGFRVLSNLSTRVPFNLNQTASRGGLPNLGFARI